MSLFLYKKHSKKLFSPVSLARAYYGGVVGWLMIYFYSDGTFMEQSIQIKQTDWHIRMCFSEIDRHASFIGAMGDHHWSQLETIQYDVGREHWV